MHNNHFNKSFILDDNEFYFNCDKCITSLLEKQNIQERELFIHNNLEKLRKNTDGQRFLTNMRIF